MERIRPLIGSVDAPDHRQPWRTGGLWRRTINLYVVGGALLTLCDLASRTLFAPFELPVGILLSALGAPFFLFLLIRRRAHD